MGEEEKTGAEFCACEHGNLSTAECFQSSSRVNGTESTGICGEPELLGSAYEATQIKGDGGEPIHSFAQ